MDEARENVKMSAECKWCGEPLAVDHIGPCPKCRKEGKHVNVEIVETITLKDSLGWEWRREFFEENPKIKWLIILITFGSPFLGLIFSGAIGVIIGLILGFVTYLLGPYAVTKVREVERGRSS